MAENADIKLDESKAEAAAEQAYAAAAATPEVKPVAEAPVAKVVVKPAAPKAKQAPDKAAAKAAIVKKTVAVKKATKPAVKKTAPIKTVKAAAKTAAKPVPVTKLKDTIMAKTKTATEDFTAKVQETVAEAQDRAKAAFEKGQALFGDAGEFTKGNVEALVESGKVLAAGLQTMGKGYVTEGKSAIETVQADIKELAAVKSPADFFKLQGEIMRRNFDAAVASGSKHSESVLKLANETFAPLSTRVSMAIEKAKKAA